MYKWMLIAVVGLWLAAMTALIRRDVWPAWTAQDAPSIDAGRLGPRASEKYVIRDADDHPIGTAWSEVRCELDGNTTIEGTIVVEGLTLIPPVRIESVTGFDRAGELDNFHLDVYGVPMTVISVHGERRGIYFPCELQIGVIRRQANLDMAASRMIGESLRPFTVLPKLHVGQSWRMQILDPLSAIQRKQPDFKSVVAQVTGRETIETETRDRVECFVVEIRDQQTKAWVADDGRVLRQEVAVPGLRKLTLTAQEFDEDSRKQARQRVHTMYRPEGGSHDGGN